MIEPAARNRSSRLASSHDLSSPELRGGFRSIGHKRDHACPWGHSDSGRSARRITPPALIKPARLVEDVTVRAVAARDPERARKFADKHGIPTVHTSYEDLLADPEIDAIYNPLPNSLHAPWTLKAIDAGKHVLCEKPFTSNAAEAQTVADAAASSDRVVVEAFHYRYHPSPPACGRSSTTAPWATCLTSRRRW